MSEHFITSITTVLLAIVGVGFLAVLVSNNANTSGVLTGGARAFSTALGSAFQPLGAGGGFTGFGNLPSFTFGVG